MMKPLGYTCFLALALFLLQPSNASAITVVTHFIGGAAPANSVGGGNLEDVFNAAARRWELAYGDSFTLTLYFGWASVGDAGTHTLIEQGGDQNRELTGTILFDNSGAVPFFLDATPDLDEEYRRRTEEFQDLGGGLVNVARVLSSPAGDAAGHVDLLSVALHEIGHSLGLSGGNLSFLDAGSNGMLTVGADLPFAGTLIPLSSNYSGIVPHFDVTRLIYGSLMEGVNGDERRIPSAMDILADAQISGFRLVNLNPTVELVSSSSSRTSRSVPGNPVSDRKGN